MNGCRTLWLVVKPAESSAFKKRAVDCQFGPPGLAIVKRAQTRPMIRLVIGNGETAVGHQIPTPNARVAHETAAGRGDVRQVLHGERRKFRPERQARPRSVESRRSSSGSAGGDCEE